MCETSILRAAARISTLPWPKVLVVVVPVTRSCGMDQSRLVSSTAMPPPRESCEPAPPRFWKGSTAIDFSSNSISPLIMNLSTAKYATAITRKIVMARSSVLEDCPRSAAGTCASRTNPDGVHSNFQERTSAGMKPIVSAMTMTRSVPSQRRWLTASPSSRKASSSMDSASGTSIGIRKLCSAPSIP